MVRVLPFGEAALLVERDSLEAVLALHAQLAASAPSGVVDVVPAARTVLVHVDPRVLPLAVSRAWIERSDAAGGAVHAPPGPLLELDIVYDGPDLDSTAELLGLAPAELAARHAAAEWTVAFTGFAPGFGYLTSAQWPVDVPRLDAPRTRVPAGAVGVASGFTGAYPRSSPGGWRLIGTTTAALFDPHAAQPALLTPGTRVRFRPTPPHPSQIGDTFLRRPHVFLAPSQGTVAKAGGADAGGAGGTDAGGTDAGGTDAGGTGVADAGGADAAGAGGTGAAGSVSVASGDAGPAGPKQAVGHSSLQRPPEYTQPSQASVAEAGAADGAGAGAAAQAAFRIIEPGPLATVQDLGRAGHLAEAIAASGAADRGALRTANRLVGNVEQAAGLELTMGGVRAVALADLWFAVTGAWGAITLDGRAIDPFQAQRWPEGAELCVAVPDHGVRSYLAVRGGIDAPRLLGSRACDTLGGLGPAPLRAGDRCLVADDIAGPVPAEDLHPWSPTPGGELALELAAGPQTDWFTPAALRALFDAVWTVDARTDRVGTRLDGPELTRVRTGELPSEPVLPGAVQVPPGGPVVLGPDAPATGGYPVIAVMTDASLDLLAQARPGTRLRFRHARPQA